MEDPPADPVPERPSLTVDARGHRCPVPTLRLRRALEGAASGQRVRLLADDPMARIDVPHFVAEAGHVLVEAGGDGAELRFLVEKR
jgi:tRNA 2-thiouridine synthesizing protein A